MDKELYLRLRNAYDDMLNWAVKNNNSKRTKDEWNEAKADKMQEMLVKYNLCVVDLNTL